MAKASDKEKELKQIEKPVQHLSDTFQKGIRDISNSVTGFNRMTEDERDKIERRVDKIIGKDTVKLSNYAGNDISRFLVNLYNKDEKYNSGFMNSREIRTIDDIFKADKGDLLSFFQDRYKNKYYLYDDLKLVADQLPELKTAISVTRDSIVTSDDFAQAISCTRTFKGSTDEDDIEIYDEYLEKIDEEYKIPQKIKNHIIPKTLQYGDYYVYTIPYSKILEKYEYNKVSNRNGEYDYKTVAQEASLFKNSDEFDIVIESIEQAPDIEDKQKVTSTQVMEELNGYLENIRISNTGGHYELLLESDLDSIVSQVKTAQTEFEKMKNPKTGNMRQQRPSESGDNYFTDAVVDKKSKDIQGMYDSYKGCYIKLIAPTRIIPIKILNNVTLGYYFLHDDEFAMVGNKKGPTTTNGLMPSFLDAVTNDKHDLERELVTSIANKVVKSFDKKFLEKNDKFKDTIISALMFDDLYRKNVTFEFIPAEYITEFSVNQDEENNGTSMLSDSLFYAKLYLSLLIFKMMSIINRSNDTRIFSVKNSGVDSNMMNKVQDVARQVKAKQMSFMDLMNCNSMVTKLGGAKDIFMPVGASGERGIEFDVMSGQQVELNTELMELLRNNFMNATGVPANMLETVKEVQFAKQLVMENARFVGKTINYQMDFNPQLTLLYKKILKYSTNTPEAIINSLVYKLTPPKELNVNNTAERIGNVQAVVQLMTEAEFGVNAEQTPEMNKCKDHLTRMLTREQFPNLPWDMLDKFKAECEINTKLDMEKEKIQQGGAPAGDGDDMMGDGGF